MRVLGGQFVVVDAVDDGQVGALGRGRDQHALGAGVEMLLAAFAVGEEAGAFERDVDAIGLVRQLGRVALGGDLDALAVDDQIVAVGLDLAREAPVDAVALEQPGVGLGVGEVVDRDQLEPAIGPLEDRARDQPADAAEAVDCNFGHCISLFFSELDHARRDRVGGQAEMFVQVGRRRRGAEAVDADAQAVQAGIALPAEGRPGLDRDAQDLAVRDVGQDVLAIGGVLRVEPLGATASRRRRRRSPALRAARRRPARSRPRSRWR